MARRRRPVKRPPAGAGQADLMRWYVADRMREDPAVERDVERSCTSKQQYADEADARAHAAMNGMADVLYTYECRYCGFWHLTRRPT